VPSDVTCPVCGNEFDSVTVCNELCQDYCAARGNGLELDDNVPGGWVSDEPTKTDFDQVWRWKPSPTYPANRYGRRSRIVASGEMNSICVEFEDGFRIIASRYAVRKIKASAM
jgi:hypothetical protein